MADAFTGLTSVEAQARLAAEGRNEPPAADRRTPFRIVLDVLREPMLALLLASGLLYLLLGDLREALILLAFALISIVITIVQETRTERVLEALRTLSSPRALVIRDGARQRIPGVEVARGDLLVLEEGERAPADALLAQSHDLMVDESLLTGEAFPVRKRVAPEGAVVAEPRPGGEDQPHFYSGSLITRGSALAVVTQTGPRSVIGQIGRSLGELEREPPRLQAQTRRMVLIFSVVGISFSVMTVLLYGYTRGDWLQAALAGILGNLPHHGHQFLAHARVGRPRFRQMREQLGRAFPIEGRQQAWCGIKPYVGIAAINRLLPFGRIDQQKSHTRRPVLLLGRRISCEGGRHGGNALGERSGLGATEGNRELGRGLALLQIAHGRPHAKGGRESDDGVGDHRQEQRDQQRAAVAHEFEQIAPGDRLAGPQAAALGVRNVAHALAPSTAAKNPCSSDPAGPAS
jgi:hypothetical protein